MRWDPMLRGTIRGHRLLLPLVAALASALATSLAVVVTATPDEAGLGAPRYWTWVLTGLQVLALWAAGSKRWWGWLLGGSVQLPWIAYALVTDQLGFIFGCAISAWVQTYAFIRSRRRTLCRAMPRSKAVSSAAA